MRPCGAFRGVPSCWHDTNEQLLRGVLALGAAIALSVGGIAAVIAYPAPLFAHQVTVGELTIRSTQPIPESAIPYLRDVDLTPRVAVPLIDGPVEIYLVDSGWRRRIFFGIAPYAGGITYAGLAPRHLFLSGADFDQGLLLHSGHLIAPPRDLAYYLRHEFNHLAMADDLGFIAYARLPAWVREGIADMAALGPPDRAVLDAALGDDPVTLAQRIAFSSYPRARLLADWMLETHGYDALINTDWSEAEAITHFRAHIRALDG